MRISDWSSDVCSSDREITLPTGIDQHGQQRTAVCCLSSLNLEYFHEWKEHPLFVEDCLRFLDNVLQDFIDKAPDSMSKARYAAERERSVGLGVLGGTDDVKTDETLRSEEHKSELQSLMRIS